MKVTVLQVSNNIEGIDNRLKDMEWQIQKAEWADFIVLTELSTSGYIPNKNIWKYAEPEGEITKKWATDSMRETEDRHKRTPTLDNNSKAMERK